MDNKIKFGIVGTGSMAATMLRAFRELSDVEVTSVCSASQQRASTFAQRFGVSSSYGDLGTFLAKESIDAVYIANRNSEHHLTAVAALNAGKAVLCEKPFALTVEEGSAVITASRTARVLFMEAIWTPFLPAYARLFDLVRSGSFGGATNLYFDFGYPVLPERNPSLFALPGGGVLLDRSGYGISFALNIFGPVEAVAAALSVNDQGIDTGAVLQLTHRNGGHSQICVSLTSLLSNSALVACTNGLLGLRPPTIGAEEVFFQRAAKPAPTNGADAAIRGKPRAVEQLRRHSLFRRIKAVRSRPSVERHSYGANPYLAQARHFSELVRSGSVESSVNTLDLSLGVLRAIEAAKTAEAIGQQGEIRRS